MRHTLSARAARENRAAYLFLTPALLFMIVFVVIPTVWAFALSFMKWDMIAAPKFVGLDQWRKVFTSSAPQTSIVTTLLIVLLSSPVTILFGLFIAVMLDKIPAGKIAYRTIFFAPFVASLTAISFVWIDLFETEMGILNYFVKAMGLSPVKWLTDYNMARASVSIVLIWQNVGFNMLIFLAGLQTIDESYYEAAIVDGAGGTDIFWKITFPMLSPYTFFLLINMIIRGFQLYESVYIITGGGPGKATSTLVYYIYQTAFVSYNAGLASAMSIVLFALIGVCTVAMWSVQRKWVFYAD